MYNVITKRCVAVRIRRRGGRGVFIFRHWNRFVCKFSGVDVTVDNRGRRRALLPFHGTDTDTFLLTTSPRVADAFSSRI